jgi:hypothetical protein
MKKYILSVFGLTILLVCTFLPGCVGENSDINWNDIPVYPGAELLITRNLTVLPPEEPWSVVEWRYYLAADKYSSGEVASFYEAEMLANGWQDISGLGFTEIEDILWDYHEKINLYIPPNIVGRLGSWGYYAKNDERDWAAVWMGINNEWEIADKIYIVILQAK